VPTIVIPDLTKPVWLDNFLQGAGVITCHLYVNNHVPDDSDSIGDYVEADFGNYSPRTVDSWEAPLQREEGVVTVSAMGVQFTYDGTGGTEKIYGAYFTDHLGQLLWVQEVSNPPRYLVDPGDTIGVIPEIGLTSKPPPLPPGPGGAAVAALLYTSQNKDSVPLLAGQVVTVHASGTGIVRAAATPTTGGVGIVTAPAAVGEAPQIQTDGVVSLLDWSSSTGTVSLSPRGVYYLDTVQGGLTLTPPTATGQVVQVIGRALSSTELDLEIGEPILL
jgi:hypothetical protein